MSPYIPKMSFPYLHGFSIIQLSWFPQENPHLLRIGHAQIDSPGQRGFSPITLQGHKHQTGHRRASWKRTYQRMTCSGCFSLTSLVIDTIGHHFRMKKIYGKNGLDMVLTHVQRKLIGLSLVSHLASAKRHPLSSHLRLFNRWMPEV